VPSCSKCGGPLDGATGDVCPKCLLSLGVNSELEKALESGTMFHGLEIIQILGRGGMGVVYKARQPQLDRIVALKVLPKAMGQDQEFAQRFVREARALASLQHPNIVAVHDFGKEGDSYFFVMEFVDGTNLRAIMREGKLTADEALNIIPRVCDALNYAHQEGIVHRDIKPENILMDKKGRVKVADFGLAKMIGGERTVLQNMTQSNVVMGTPHYMAPEQFENAKHVDHRADIYSLGVMLYEMLTGELPIGKFESPSKRVQVDVRLDEIVLRTLEKAPEKRYQSMDEFSKEISRISEKRGVKPPGGGIPIKFVGIGVALLLAAFVIYLVATRTPTVEPTPAPATAIELVKPGLAQADGALTELLAAVPEAKKDINWTGEPPKGLLAGAKVLFAESDGTGSAIFESPKGRIDFKATKTDKGWTVVEISLPVSGARLTWSGTAWTRIVPEKRDPWLLAVLTKDELPAGWKIETAMVDEESRGGVTKMMGWFGMQEVADGCEKGRHLMLMAPGAKKVHVYFYKFKDDAAIDRALKHLQKNYLSWNRFLLDKAHVMAWVVPEGNDGRMSVGLNEIEDKLRAKLLIEPAKRIDPSALKDDDLPAGWTVLSPAKIYKGIETATLLALLKELPLPDANDIREGWVATVGKAGTPETVQIVSLRTFESEPVSEAVPALRTYDPPAGKEMKILAESSRVVVLIHGTRDPAKQAPFDELSKKISTRLGYSADDLRPKAKGVDVAFDDQGMTVIFDVDGVSARELSKVEWDVQLWTSYNVGFKMKMKAPEFSRSGKMLRGTLRVPMSGDLREFLEMVPDWVSARVTWSTAKDERAFDFSISNTAEKVPAAYRKAFGSILLAERDMPKGWGWAREWEGVHVPTVADEDETRAWLLKEFFSDIERPDTASLHLGYVAALAPNAKIEQFEGAVVLILEFTDAETAGKLAEKAKAAKNLARSDKQWVEVSGKRVLVGLVFGANPDAERAIGKVVASVKSRLE